MRIELSSAALAEVARDIDLTNAVTEADCDNGEIVIRRYDWPS